MSCYLSGRIYVLIVNINIDFYKILVPSCLKSVDIFSTAYKITGVDIFYRKQALYVCLSLIVTTKAYI